MHGHDALAERLATAHRSGTPVTLGGPDSAAAGYAVQDSLVDRLADTAGSVVGYKLGFTNEAVQAELGVSEPVYGRLLADTVRSPDATQPPDAGGDGQTVGLDENDRPRIETSVPTGSFVDPRVEPELVVRLDAPVADTATPETIATAVGGVAPAIELVDSRTGTWSPSVGTAVADNALAAGLVTGPERPLEAADPADVSVTIETTDDRHTGDGTAVMNGPLRAVAWLAGAVGGLSAGTLVSTGSLTETLPFDEPVQATFEPLGTVCVRPA